MKYFPSKETASLFKTFVYKEILSIDPKESNKFDSNSLQEFNRCHAIKSLRNIDKITTLKNKSSYYMISEQRPATVHFKRLLPHDVRGQYQRLRVTWILREGATRRILNFHKVQKMIIESGLVDIEWFLKHTLYFSNLDFRDQISIMSCTDVLLTVHSSGIFNGIFLPDNSVVIQLFMPRFIEFTFSPALRESSVHVINVAFRMKDIPSEYNLSDCDNIPDDCLNLPTTFAGNKIDCFKLRGCSFPVDLSIFHTAFMEAYYYVLSAKWT